MQAGLSEGVKQMVSGKGLVHAAGMVKRNFSGADLIATKSPLDSLS